jgi:hypothetical protein
VIAAAAIANQIFRQLGHDSGAEPATYVAVPESETARWLLPAGSPEIGSVLANWAPYRLSSRVGWAAVRAASRIGRLAAIPGVAMLEVEGSRGADWASLGWRSSEPPIPVIYLGTPGSKRKAVVHLVERVSGECQAIVKVPLTDEAKTAVLHEAEVLRALKAEGYEIAPRLLHVDWAQGISTQTFVEGRPGLRRLAPEYWRTLCSLLLPGETTSLPEHAEKWAEIVFSPNDDGQERRRVIEALEELHDAASLPACWQHGDFAPWNIKRLPNGGCALLDWEDAERKGLPLQDAYHFLHMQDFLFEGRPKLHATEMRGQAIEMGVGPSQCRRLEVAYLVGAYVKCLKLRDFERARFVSRTLGLCRSRAA